MQMREKLVLACHVLFFLFEVLHFLRIWSSMLFKLGCETVGLFGVSFCVFLFEGSLSDVTYSFGVESSVTVV